MINNLKNFLEKAKERNGKDHVTMIYDMEDKVHITYYQGGNFFENELIGGHISAISNEVKGKNKVIVSFTNSKGRIVSIPVEDIKDIK